MGSRTRIRPRQAGDAGFHGEAHQVMPGGVELDLIAPPPEAVVRVQHGRILVRERTPLDGLGGAYPAAELVEQGASPCRMLTNDGLAQVAIGREQIVIRQRRRLVQYLIFHVRSGGGPTAPTASRAPGAPDSRGRGWCDPRR